MSFLPHLSARLYRSKHFGNLGAGELVVKSICFFLVFAQSKNSDPLFVLLLRIVTEVWSCSRPFFTQILLQTFALGWNISLLFLPKNRNISDFRGFFTSIYFTLETCSGYENRSEFIQEHYSINTTPNQTQTEAESPFFHPKISLKVK